MWLASLLACDVRTSLTEKILFTSLSCALNIYVGASDQCMRAASFCLSAIHWNGAVWMLWYIMSKNVCWTARHTRITNHVLWSWKSNGATRSKLPEPQCRRSNLATCWTRTALTVRSIAEIAVVVGVSSLTGRTLRSRIEILMSRRLFSRLSAWDCRDTYYTLPCILELNRKLIHDCW